MTGPFLRYPRFPPTYHFVITRTYVYTYNASARYRIPLVCRLGLGGTIGRVLPTKSYEDNYLP